MSDLRGELALLQFGDSFFPTGAASFSWGLETLRADALVRDAAGLDAFIAAQLEHRWADFDRPAVVAAHRAGPDLDRVLAVDRQVDAGTLAREARDGGRRIGAALLKIHADLGTTGAGIYRERVLGGQAPGQMATVQGLIGAACGLDEAAACALSAYGVAVGIVSAAVRMAIVGHVDGQRILAQQRERAARLAEAPLRDAEQLQAYTPMTEIAMMRHETGSGRLFAN
jgi:urease accessory protein